MLYSQNQDFRSWWNVDVSTDINKDLAASFKLGQRFRSNSLQFDRSLATFALEVDLPKGFSAEGGIRYILLKDDGRNFVSRYRIHGDISYSHRFDRLRIAFRERVQYGFDDLNSIDDYSSNKLTNRNRASVKYDIFGIPFSLQASYEIFLAIGGEEKLLISDHRIRAGFEYKISQNTDLDVYYLLDQEVNRNDPLQSHILLVTLGYSF
jgi:predicted porin